MGALLLSMLWEFWPSNPLLFSFHSSTCESLFAIPTHTARKIHCKWPFWQLFIFPGDFSSFSDKFSIFWQLQHFFFLFKVSIWCSCCLRLLVRKFSLMIVQVECLFLIMQFSNELFKLMVIPAVLCYLFWCIQHLRVVLSVFYFILCFSSFLKGSFVTSLKLSKLWLKGECSKWCLCVALGCLAWVCVAAMWLIWHLKHKNLTNS